MEKQKKSVQKWQATVQWLCFAIWAIISAIEPFSLWNCAAALCLFASAVLTTTQYRKQQWEGTP